MIPNGPSIPRLHTTGLATPMLLALLALPACRGAGPEADPAVAAFEDRLATADATVAEWVDIQLVPGAVLSVSRGGEVVLEKAYGAAQIFEYAEGQYGAAMAGERRPGALERLAEPRPMTSDTVFDLASVSKVMATTFAVMLLVDQGAVNLDAPVSTYLGDFEGDGKDAITVRHLLSHRAGLHQWKPIYYHAATPQEAYEHIRDLPLAWPVDDGRHYSDLGFMLLGLVVERVSGLTLDRFLEERLYEPLGLTATGFRPRDAARPNGAEGRIAATSHGNPYEHRMVHDDDFGYPVDEDADSWNGWRTYTLIGEVNDANAFHAFGGVAGHAGLFSTAADLQVLLQLLLDRGEVDGRRLISAELVDTFLAPAGGGQALGWQLPGHLPPGSFAHPGFTGTYVLGVPSEQLGVVLLTNRQNLGVDPRGYYRDLNELYRNVSLALIGATTQ